MTAKTTATASGEQQGRVPGTVRAQQKAETRARILQCALDAFAERGFAGAGIRDIATAAGVNHGLIRYHFKNKDQLWKAAVEFLFDRLHSEMLPPPEDRALSPYERARTSLHRYVRYCARHPEHARIMVQESIRDSDRLTWAVEHFIKPDHDILSVKVRSLIDQKIYRDVPVHSLNYIMAASAQSIFMLAKEVKQVYGLDAASDEVIEAHADAMVKLFFEDPDASR
ncbi:MAG TPA: TetR/AcrR family transcriptional regulator [Kineobactrum sp.]